MADNQWEGNKPVAPKNVLKYICRPCGLGRKKKMTTKKWFLISDLIDLTSQQELMS